MNLPSFKVSGGWGFILPRAAERLAAVQNSLSAVNHPGRVLSGTSAVDLEKALDPVDFGRLVHERGGR